MPQPIHPRDPDSVNMPPRVRQGTSGTARHDSFSASSDGDASDANSDSQDDAPAARTSSAPRLTRPTSEPDARQRNSPVSDTFLDGAAWKQSTGDESDDNAGAIHGTTDPDEDGYVMRIITIRHGKAGNARSRNESGSGTATADAHGSATAASPSGDRESERASKAKPLSRLRAALGAMRVSDRARTRKPPSVPADDALMSRASLVAYSKDDSKAEKRRLEEERERSAAFLARLPGSSDYASKRSDVVGAHASSAMHHASSGKSGTGKTGE